jgi:hypothetical protein
MNLDPVLVTIFPLLMYFFLIAPLEERWLARLDARVGVGFRGYFMRIRDDLRRHRSKGLSGETSSREIFGSALLLSTAAAISLLAVGPLSLPIVPMIFLLAVFLCHENEGVLVGVAATLSIFFAFVGLAVLSGSWSVEGVVEWQRSLYLGMTALADPFACALFVSALVAGLALFERKPFQVRNHGFFRSLLRGYGLFVWSMLLARVFLGCEYLLSELIVATGLYWLTTTAGAFLPRNALPGELRILLHLLFPVSLLGFVGALGLKLAALQWGMSS